MFSLLIRKYPMNVNISQGPLSVPRTPRRKGFVLAILYINSNPPCKSWLRPCIKMKYKKKVRQAKAEM